MQVATQLTEIDARGSGFEDLAMVHNPLPELDLVEIDCSCVFMGKKLTAPLLINAITGGHKDLVEINRSLARAAAVTGIGMAVGSQQAALENPALRYTFSVVREEMPRGLLLANLSARCSLSEARTAIEMIDADGIQLHLNAGQELVMSEGDTGFSGLRKNIAYLVQNLHVPVMVKEVGFGMAGETIKDLHRLGVKYIDISGRGGTNFAVIEEKRRGKRTSLRNWGIPSAISLLEAVNADLPVTLIASGGLRSAMDMLLALAAGAAMTAMAGPFLKRVVKNGVPGLESYIHELIAELRQLMLLAGARSTAELLQKPLVITGNTAQWLQRRGVDINIYARR